MDYINDCKACNHAGILHVLIDKQTLNIETVCQQRTCHLDK